jgi:hypothetical protein
MCYIIYFFLDNVNSTCFGCYLHPSSGAQLQRTAIGICMVWCVFFPLEQVLVLGHFNTLARSVTDCLYLTVYNLLNLSYMFWRALNYSLVTCSKLM